MQRWLARLAFAALTAAVAVLVLAGALRSVTALLVGLAGLAVSCAAAWWVIARRGAARWLAAALLVAVPAGVITLYVLVGLLWEISLATALAAAGLLAGRRALLAGLAPGGPAPAGTGTPPPEVTAAPPRRPFLIMNPRSGGGKVKQFNLVEEAQFRGIEPIVLRPGDDLRLLAEDAASRADVIGM
ncbi:MAG TPA: hypothetical protein VGH88_23335, partial [Streptosporangiaceae bacterium]